MLVVDDQFNVRRMIYNFLRNFGYTDVVFAPDGAVALETVEKDEIQFIIADWNMPRMNGLVLLKHIRANRQTRPIPFLMVTAEVNEEIVAEAIEAGVDDYIIKPFKAATLAEKIEKILLKRSNPNPVDQALYAAKDLMGEGRAKEAVAVLKNVLTAAPKTPKVLVAVGEALEALNQEDLALAKYQEAASLADRYVTAHDKAAQIYKKKGDLASASKHLKAASSISPRNPQRQLQLGKMLMDQGDTKAAMSALSIAKEVAGDDAAIASEVGETLLEAGMNQEAAEAFREAVDIDPKMIHVYNRLGIAYRRQGRFDLAVIEYRRALKVAPNDENLHFNLAVALFEARRSGEARGALETALRIRPDFPEAKELLTRMKG